MTKEQITKLKTLGQAFSVLYVEDDPDIRGMVASILEQLFFTVYVAEDGAEGLAMFKTYPVDLIFTDIEMPVMNGLEMVQHIRALSYDMPVCVISAFNDVEKFTQAIRIGVNRYLIKPIEQEYLIGTIYDMLVDLKNKIDAKQYYKELQDKQIADAVEKTAQYFLQSIPSPVFVLDKTYHVIYVNSLVREMFDKKGSQIKLGDSAEKIFDLFTLPTGAPIAFDASEQLFLENKTLRFKHEKELYFYVPRVQEVLLPAMHTKELVVILNDITAEVKYIRMIEYQKSKVAANKEILEEFLHRNIFIRTPKEEAKAQEILEKTEFEEDMELLRRTHIYKISAADYMATLSDTIEDSLAEMSELELDIQSALYEFEYSKQDETLQKIGSMFVYYANVLVKLIEFSDLADAVKAVSMYVRSLEQAHVDVHNFIIKTVLQSVLDDLVSWHEHVFVTQSTKDIHYLDSSLYNTIIELKNAIEQESAIDEDVEFF